jgi:hypothetical protein
MKRSINSCDRFRRNGEQIAPLREARRELGGAVPVGGYSADVRSTSSRGREPIVLRQADVDSALHH